MNPQLKMLLWKEYRERRGQLLLGLALAGLCTLGAVLWTVAKSPRGGHPLPFPWEPMAAFYIFIVPVLVAMRTSCGEATDHTAAFTRSLPLAPARAGWLRLVSGGCVLTAPIVLVPILATVALALTRSLDPTLPAKCPALMPADWSGVGHVWVVALLLMVAAVGCYVQLALVGTLVRRENQSALLGTVWTILWFFAALSHPRPLELISPHALLFRSAFQESAPPEGSLSEEARLMLGTGGNLALIVLWSVLFVVRQGRRSLDVGRRSAATRRRDRLTGWLPAWRIGALDRLRATRFGALAWLAMRQSLPMCLAALAIASAISAMLWTAGNEDTADWPVWKMTALVWTIMTAMVGILWASVVGVGSVADEIDRRSGDFWRTRPIPFWPLFTIKFLVGLVVVAVVLDGPMAALGKLVAFGADPPNFYPTAWVHVACMVPVHGVMFAQALCWACLLRRAALGAMAALATLIAFMLAGIAFPVLVAFAPTAMYNELLREAKARGGHVDLSTCGYPGVVAVLALATLAAYLIAGYSLSTYSSPRAVQRGAFIHRFPGPRRLLRLRQTA